MKILWPISFKSVFLFIFLVMASSWFWKWAPGVAEARGAFRCPQMIECNSVCQGFPNCCVNGRCFCQPCSTLPPLLPNRSLCHGADDNNCRH